MSKRLTTKVFDRIILVSLLGFIIGSVFLANFTAIAGSDNDGITDVTENNLMNLYKPNLIFRAGESFYPVDVDFMISNSELFERPGGLLVVNPIVVVPAKDNLDNYPGQYYFLKYDTGTFADLDAIKSGYNTYKGANGYTVYTHVTNDSGFTFVQYWFFYAYNDGSINQHEGDWEMIQIQLDSSTQEPLFAQYSQHHTGENTSWVEVEKTDSTHPNVYVAKGSHANYFRGYEGRLGFTGDDVGSDGITIPYNDADMTFELLGEKGAGNHPAPGNAQDWMDFGGRWGDWAEQPDAELGFAGPHGPGHSENAEKWDDPGVWASSVPFVDSLWFVLCWIMYNLLYIVIGIIVLMGLWKLYKIYKVNKEGGLMVGEVMKTRAGFGVFMGFIAIGIVIYALFQPWYSVTADITSPTVTTAGQVVLIDGLNGVQVNFLVTGTGMTPLFTLGIPFSILLAAGIIFNILDIIGVKDPKKLGNGYIKSGVMFVVYLLVIIIVIALLGTIMGSITGYTEAQEVANAISAQPFGGAEFFSFYAGIVTMDLVWGFALGGILLVVSALIKIFAGAIIRSAPKDFA